MGDVGLSRALFHGNVEIVKALLEAGVEVKDSGNMVSLGSADRNPSWSSPASPIAQTRKL